MTGHAILTPTLMVLMMVTGDFLAMSSSTDNVRPSPRPNIWRIRNLTIAGIVMGVVDLLFCVACFSTGKFLLGLDTDMLRTMAVVTLVFSGQASFTSRGKGSIFGVRCLADGSWYRRSPT